MAGVPLNRNRQTVFRRDRSQETVIVGGVPVPPRKHSLPDPIAEFGCGVGVEYWDEVARKPELVRTCVGSGLSGSFGQKVMLPHGVAERLEEFEAGLREAGLIGEDEFLRQSYVSPSHFRVQKQGVAVNGSHRDNPSVKASEPSAPDRALMEVPKRLRNRRGSQSRAVERKRPLTGEAVEQLPLFDTNGCIVPIELRRRREDLI